jgi:alkylhydroperoxidase family enzyme
MSRVPYLPLDVAEPKPLVDKIRARRGGNLINLDRLLLHSPSLAEGWNAYMGTVRKGLALDPYLGELAICVIAVLNHAPYEFHHHAPEWRAAGGSDEQIAALSLVGSDQFDRNLFSPIARAVIDLTIEMTRAITVSPATFARLKEFLAEDQHVVELIATIGAYNMVSRFLVALEIDPDEG